MESLKYGFCLTKVIKIDNLGIMKKIKLLKVLEKSPVFNLKTVKDITGKKGSYVKILIFRLKKEGLIFEIEKNKYTVHKDPLVIASYLVWPCYLSFWTALRHHDLTEQLPNAIFVATTRAKKNRLLRFNGTEIIFTKIKPSCFFGFAKEKYRDFDIFVAEPEKAVIDSALFKKLSFSEISHIVRDSITNFDTDKLIRYLLRVKSKALIKRFGFLLDSAGKDVFDKLRHHVSGEYIKADYALAKRGKKNKKWKVIENVKL